MTDPNRPTPAQTGDAATGGRETRPPDRGSAAPNDPIAAPDGASTSAGEAAREDPDALDQSVGRGDVGQGDAMTRDGAI